MAVHNSVQVAIPIVLVPSICLYYLFRQQFNYEAIMDMEQATTGHECKITNHHDMVVVSRLLPLFLNYCHRQIFKLCMTILLSQFF
jgi:hypothetical protein